MATFQLTGPDGSNYQVTAPDEQSALSAFSAFHGGGQQQSAPAQPAAPPPDKYQQAAAQDIANAQKNGVADTGYTRRLVHGATLGADNTIMAGLETPLEMIKHGTLNPAEGYDYAKAREDMELNQARQNTGILGDAAEMLGGAATGGSLTSGASGLAKDAAGQIVAKAAPQITLAKYLTPQSGLLARSAASAGDAAALGGVTGFNEGNGIGDRLAKAAGGAVTGGLVGGALPVAGALVHSAAAPFVSNTKALFNPEGFAQSQVARAVHESGMTPDQIDAAVQQAAQEGQPQFTTADAMGNAGQELLGTAARGPGPGRTQIVEAMDRRQAGQGRRIANTLSEGFDSRMTPDQMRTSMEASRGDVADQQYGDVRNGAGRVDTVPTINNLDRNIGTAPGQTATPSNDSVESALQPFRDRLARVNPDDFEAVQRIRGDMADAAQTATRQGQNNKARLIGQALRQLDSSMEAASPGFRQANADFRGASNDINAIDAGRTAAVRGRTEDTIPAYQALGPRGQAAFRTGYVDPLIQNAQGGPMTANKARPLISDAFQDESAAMAPRNNLMQRKIGREDTMFQTRNTALGGSPTAKNLAHDQAGGIDPALAMHVITGNIPGALGHVIAAGKNAMTGNTPAVRQAIANILLKNGATGTPGQLAQMVDGTIARMRLMQNWGNVARAARSGGQVAVTQEATAPPPPQRLHISPARR